MRAALVILVLALWPAEASAQIAGIGGRTCSQFAKDYLESREIAEPLYFTYAQGYLSALAMLFSALKKTEVNLGALSSDQQKAHIRKYCSDHSDTAYVWAVQNLFETLQKLSRNSN
jgi:hypothetical protein